MKKKDILKYIPIKIETIVTKINEIIIPRIYLFFFKTISLE